MYLIKLDCGHQVITEVLLRQQYPEDEHFIYCPACRVDPKVAMPFMNVTSVQELTDESLQYVQSGTSIIVPRDVLRFQPRVPANRKRPLPYVND